MQETLRTVKYAASDAIKFEKIALKLGRSKRLVFSQMVDYFYRSKKDPIDLNDELLKNTILKGQKTYVEFIKTQEAELLIPIKRDIANVLEIQEELWECFNVQVLKHNEQLLQGQQVQAIKLGAFNEIFKSIEGKVVEKERMKSRFLYILNAYIKSRDALGLMSSSREKEELAFQIREQVNML